MTDVIPLDKINRKRRANVAPLILVVLLIIALSLVLGDWYLHPTDDDMYISDEGW